VIDLRRYPALWGNYPIQKGPFKDPDWDVSANTALFLYLSELHTFDPVTDFMCFEDLREMLKREPGDDFFQLRWVDKFEGVASEMVRAERFRRGVQAVDWVLKLEDGQIRVEVTT